LFFVELVNNAVADSFKLSVEKRSIDYSYFSSEQEFETSLNNCSPTLLKWVFEKE